MKKTKISKIIIFSSIFALFSIAITTVATSCSGVSKSITSNMFDPASGNGTFAKYSTGEISLKDEIQQALTDKTSTDKFKDKVVNHLIYDWFMSVKDKNVDWKEKYDTWKTSADDAYKNKVNQYKSQHHGDWPYYFRNEVLNPLGGTKQDFIDDQMYSSVRSWFNDQVFANQYLSLADNSEPYNPGSSVKKSPGELLNSNGEATTLADSLKWGDIDFYAKNSPSYTTTDVNQDVAFSQIQHKAFDIMTELQRPVSTSMTLWKYSDYSKGMDKVYNSDYCASASSTTKAANGTTVGDDPTPTPTPTPASIKSSYQFPYFDNGNQTSWSNTTNQKFFDMVKDGDFLTSATPFNVPNSSQLNTLNSSSSTGAIRIPVKDTDDQSCVFKVSLAGNAFTSLNVTYAGATSYLWNHYSQSTSTQELPYGKINQDSVTNRQKADIMKNFIFTDDKSITNSNPISNVLNSGSTVDTSIDLTNMYTNVSTTAGKVQLDLFADPAKNGNTPNPWFTDGYDKMIGAFQLSTTISDGANDTIADLPFILIREEPGVHLIGLDCLGYLFAPVSSFTSTTSAQTDKLGEPFTQQRENNVLKMRSLQSIKNDAYEWKDSKFDFTGKGGELNTFYTSNTDDVLLSIASDALSGTAPDWNMFKGILKQSQYTNFSKWYSIIEHINIVSIWQNAVTSWNDSNKNIFKFINTQTTNIRYGFANTPPGDKKIGNSYHNGLAAPYPFSISNGSDAYVTNYNEGNNFNSNMRTHFNGISPIIDNAKEVIHNIDSTISVSEGTFSTSALTTKLLDVFSPSGVPIISYEPSYHDGDYAKYSEDMLVKSSDAIYGRALNSMLWQFCSTGNNFINKLKIDAFKSYLGTNNYETISEDSDKFGYEIANQYFKSKVVTSDEALNSYSYGSSIDDHGANLVDSATPTNLAQLLQNEYKLKNSNNSGWASDYSDEKLSYYTFLSSIKYLSDNNHKNFITWLRNKIGKDNMAFAVWNVKDNINAHPNFSSDTNAYSWQTNLNNTFNTTYTSAYHPTISAAITANSITPGSASTATLRVVVSNASSSSAPTATFATTPSSLTISSGATSGDNIFTYTITSTTESTGGDYKINISLPGAYPVSINLDVSATHATTPTTTTTVDTTSVPSWTDNTNATSYAKDGEAWKFGYVGLQTSSDSALHANVKDALFNKFGLSVPSNLNRQGALFNFAPVRFSDTKTGTYVGQDSLSTYIDGLNSTPAITTLATTIKNNLGGTFFEPQLSLISQTQSIFSDDGSAATVKEKKFILNAILNNWNSTTSTADQDGYDPKWFNAWGSKDVDGTFAKNYNIPSTMMDTYVAPIQQSSGAYAGVEIKNPVSSSANSNLIYEGTTASDIANGDADRTTIRQINYGQLSVQKIDGSKYVDDYAASYTNAVTLLGEEVVKQLLVNAAMDTTVQGKTLNEVIQNQGFTVDVYDRRFNDTLGKLWVKNYKTDN